MVALSTSTPYQRILLSFRFSIGNWVSGLLVRRHVVEENSADCRSAFKRTKVCEEVIGCGGIRVDFKMEFFFFFEGIVDEENCWSNAEGTRPTEKTRHCNEDSCPANWWVGPWQLCPVTCKKHGM